MSHDGKKHKVAPPPDSWEEDAVLGSDLSSGSTTPLRPSTPHNTTPGPPPPTPMNPTHHCGKDTDWASFSISAPLSSSKSTSSGTSSMTKRDGTTDKRPEKSSATAGRLIAGALGVRVPQMGEEGRRYERAVREKEKNKLRKEKDEEARRVKEVAEAKRAVWDS